MAEVNINFSMTLERFEELITTEDGLLENKLVSIENVMINPTNISSVVEKKIGVPAKFMEA